MGSAGIALRRTNPRRQVGQTSSEPRSVPVDAAHISAPMTTITPTALNFARNHVQAFYASDFFPDADEFDALWAGWDQVLDFYTKADVASLGTTPEDMSCAKASGGYRIVHQLLPLDTLTYTALVSIIAPHLEEKRLPRSEEIACSYRIDLGVDGRLFRANADGYATYRRRSEALAGIYDWVLVADIAGFYNHIYVHRIEGAIQTLDPALASVASDLHDFLLNLNDKVSIGIPVGPAASIVVAELILNDVDQFLRAHRLKPEYTRYVDDFRFFSNSRLDLEEVWHDLSGFLYRAHRLTLANGKTRILPSSDFQDTVLTPPATSRRATFAKTLNISFADFASQYGDAEHIESGEDEPASPTEKREALQALVKELLMDPELNIGLTRQVLRRARSLRMRCVVRPLIQALEKVAPVIRDAGLYLEHVLSERSLSNHADSFERFFKTHPRFVARSHLHYWTAWLLSGKRGADQLAGCEAFLDGALPRFRARYARMLNRPQWVRDNRSEWQKLATWDRWSLLHSAKLLPPSERRVWMDSVARSPDLVDRLVAAKIRAA